MNEMGEAIRTWVEGASFFILIAVVLSIPLCLAMATGWMLRQDQVFGREGILIGDLKRLLLSTVCKAFSILPAMVLINKFIGESWAIGVLHVVRTSLLLSLVIGVMIEVLSEFIRERRRLRLTWVAMSSMLIGSLVGAEFSYVASYYRARTPSQSMKASSSQSVDRVLQ